MTLKKGTPLGPYEILSKLGEGGMGVVYMAKDSRLEREVAIKVLPDRLAQDEDAVARFQHENKVVASLSHPNIRAIYAIGRDNGRTYAVMELLEGETLACHLKRPAFNWQKAVKISFAIADGLAAAHNKGIIHRDIKPQNIFLTTEGEVKILDFGLARIMPKGYQDSKKANSKPTENVQPKVKGGTVPYMSPEQLRGNPADERTDIFAFGCVLYEMLTGEGPFFRKTHAETVAAILSEKPSNFKELGINVPRELQKIVALCLEKNPENRLQSVNDFIFMLNGIELDHSTTAEEDTKSSIAVLPFVNISPDKENEHFSDGLTDELISTLFKTNRLHVASQTSAFSFKDKNQDIRQIGRQLNVRNVIEGSVRKAGKRLRITAQLINVADGYHLWSEMFDCRMGDEFAVQHEIAHSIAGAVQHVLNKKENLSH